MGAGNRLQPLLQSEQRQVQPRHRGTAPRITTDGRTDGHAADTVLGQALRRPRWNGQRHG